MNIKLLNKFDDKKMQLLISGTDISFLNTYRRIMESRVPIMAIDDVEIRKNNSILYDEMIALRLGLTPLTTDLKTYNITDECNCNGAGCNSCSVKLTLKAKGPGYVYAKQLKSKDPNVVPVYPQMPIVKLLENQDIELECTAKLGRGINHSKWNTGVIFHRQLAEIDFKKVDDPEKIKNICPTDVFDVKAGKLVVEDADRCILCDACVEETNGEIKVNPKDEYILTVESFGMLTPKEIAVQASKEFDKLLQAFDESMKNIEKE